MKNLQINDTTIGAQTYNLVEKLTGGGVNIYNKSLYPSQGLFLLDENANVLDKNAESYPEGTIKAFGFKAGDGNWYAVDAEAIPDRKYWGGYNKLIEDILTTTNENEALKDYAGESNTDKIIKALVDFNDGYTTGAPAAEVCSSRTFNGKQGFLPALGQFKDFWQHMSEVNSLATKFSLNAFQTENYWTSTQELPKFSWRLRWISGSTAGSLRYSQQYVRAFFSLT